MTTSQDVAAVKTYLDDWTTDLAAAASVLGLGSLTITAATVTTTGGVITASSHTTTGVTFQLSMSGVTVNTGVVVSVAVTLSNGDSDVHHLGFDASNSPNN